MSLLHYYWLTSVKGLGIKRISEIINYFGNIKNAWDGSFKEFTNIKGISGVIANSIINRRDKDILAKEILEIESKGIKIITIDNEEYPRNLKDIYDPPAILYMKGNIKNCRNYIGVVGSRKCTPYGRMISRKISNLLCEYNIGIISGMARGIDTEAHIGALKGYGFTCAVLGCGCDTAYPPENKQLMKEIEERGAVVSEYSPGTLPLPSNFPARNRIISGISDCLLIVEAGEKSGALITANFALEQGKDVFAVPGSIISNPSKGTNSLIKDGAKLITDVSDILEELGIDYKIKTEYSHENLTTREKILINIVKESPIHIDDLINQVSLKLGEVNSLLTSLELKGIIKILPGKYIIRTF